MRIQITARHCEIPEAIRSRARELIQRLSRYESRLSAAELVFDVENHLKRAEAVLSIDGDEPVVARAQADEFRGALDRMVDRLGKILRRRHSQRLDHQAPSLSESVERGGGV